MSLDAADDYVDVAQYEGGGEIAAIAASADEIHHLFACYCFFVGAEPVDDASLQLRVQQLREDFRFESTSVDQKVMLLQLQRALAHLLVGDQTLHGGRHLRSLAEIISRDVVVLPFSLSPREFMKSVYELMGSAWREISADLH